MRTRPRTAYVFQRCSDHSVEMTKTVQRPERGHHSQHYTLTWSTYNRFVNLANEGRHRVIILEDLFSWELWVDA